MNKISIIFLLLVGLIKIASGYEYPKPEVPFDREEKPACPEKRRVVRGVFFYTYDDNFDGHEIEMHELDQQTFKKLISSKEYVKPPAALKTTYDIFSFFDGRCEASINCKKITEECPVAPSTTTTTTKPLPSATPWPSNPELQQEVSNLYYDIAPHLKESEIQEISAAFREANEFTKYWTADQIHQIATRNSLVVENELVKQNTSGRASIMKFSDETIQYMINYTREIIPDLSMEEILGHIHNAEDIGTVHMRYLTLDQYKKARVEVISKFSNNAEVHGFVSTTHEPTTTTTATKLSTTTKKHGHHHNTSH